MEHSVEALAPCRKKVKITLSVEDVKAGFEKKFTELNEAIALPGFRPGRAPRRLLERKFGDKLGEEVRGELVKETLEKLIEDKAFEPLAAPELDIEELEMAPDKPFEFEFEVVTRPEFETPTYKGLDVKVPPADVTDEEVEQAIEDLRRQGAKLETIEDGKIGEQDVLVVDWTASEGDSVEAKDTGAYYPYGHGVLAGFVTSDLDEQLAGKAVGTVAKSKVEVAADDPREELRGRELELEVTIKQIKRYVLPEIDEAFLGRFDYDDEDEMREEVAKQIGRQKRRGIERFAEDALVKQLVEGLDVDLPDDFVEKELENWTQRKRMDLQMEETPEEEIEKQVAEGRKDAKSAIEVDMRRWFLLERISEEENVDVTAQEMSGAVQQMAQAYGRPVEEILTNLRDGGRLAELRDQIRHRKAAEAIRATANLIEDPKLAETPDDGEKKPAAKKKAAKKKAKKKKAAKKKAAKDK